MSVCENKYECVSVCDCTHGYLVQGGVVGGTHKASLLPHKQTLCRVHPPGCRPASGKLLREGEEADTCPEREAFLSLLSTCSVQAHVALQPGGQTRQQFQ